MAMQIPIDTTNTPNGVGDGMPNTEYEIQPQTVPNDANNDGNHDAEIYGSINPPAYEQLFPVQQQTEYHPHPPVYCQHQSNENRDECENLVRTVPLVHYNLRGHCVIHMPPRPGQNSSPVPLPPPPYQFTDEELSRGIGCDGEFLPRNSPPEDDALTVGDNLFGWKKALRTLAILCVGIFLLWVVCISLVTSSYVFRVEMIAICILLVIIILRVAYGKSYTPYEG